MGLKSEIYDVFYNNLSDTGEDSVELTKFQEDKLDQLSKGLTEAIINFIQKQEFQITEMEATVDIEEIRTATSLTGMPAAPGTPVIIGGAPASPTPFMLSKKGGIGGFMMSRAKAYIGPASANNTYAHDTNNEDKTKVKLLNVKSGTDK